MKRIALILALCAISLPAWAEQVNRHITVTGEGSVQMAPDMAMISIGVTHQDKQADAAMARVSQAARAVLDQLEKAGIAARDVQTSHVNLSPVYANRSSQTGPEIEGFRADLSLTVRVRDLSQLGGVLGMVVQDGANRFSGLQFGLSESTSAKDEARQAAVADALRKARLYAQAAGVTLGQVQMISENGGGGDYPRMRMAADSVEAVPIAQGELSLRQSVTLVIGIE